MDNLGVVEIHITGVRGNTPLSLDNYDVSELQTILGQAVELLFPGRKKGRPIITYEIATGSVKHIFKTSMQAVIGFNAILGQINQNQSLNFLEESTAKAIASFQKSALKNKYYIDISTSIANSNKLSINTQTKWVAPPAEWVKAEFYFYGEVTNIGGKTNPVINLNVPSLGILRIQTPKDVLANLDINLIYKIKGIKSSGVQNKITGETDYDSLHFMEFIEYEPAYDDNYLNEIIQKNTGVWANVKDVDSWLHDLRGVSY